MVSVLKLFTLALWVAVALWFNLSDVSIAIQQGAIMDSSKVIKGKVSKIDGDNYFVKQKEEVRLHVDKST